MGGAAGISELVGQLSGQGSCDCYCVCMMCANLQVLESDNREELMVVEGEEEEEEEEEEGEGEDGEGEDGEEEREEGEREKRERERRGREREEGEREKREKRDSTYMVQKSIRKERGMKRGGTGGA